MRANFVSRTWAAGRPAQQARHLQPPPMESLLPSATKELTTPQTTTLGGRELRGSRKQLVSAPCGGSRTGICTQSFEFWAPRLLNQFSQVNPFGDALANDDDTNGLTDSHEEVENDHPTWKVPSDKFRLQRFDTMVISLTNTHMCTSSAPYMSVPWGDGTQESERNPWRAPDTGEEST
eukprot:gene10668-biopygen19822